MTGTAFPADNTGRFTGRVEAYRRFRPRFPHEIIPLLKNRCELTSASVVADLGAGTGMFSELFLENGNQVFAVEPNAEMRAACSELCSSYPRLTCADTTAEATGLPDRSVDFVTAARAFHWFDQEKCRFLAFQEALWDYFERHQSQGKLALPTSCELYFGHLQ